jgi:hypothetical protein
MSCGCHSDGRAAQASRCPRWPATRTSTRTGAGSTSRCRPPPTTTAHLPAKRRGGRRGRPLAPPQHWRQQRSALSLAARPFPPPAHLPRAHLPPGTTTSSAPPPAPPAWPAAPPTKRSAQTSSTAGPRPTAARPTPASASSPPAPSPASRRPARRRRRPSRPARPHPRPPPHVRTCAACLAEPPLAALACTPAQLARRPARRVAAANRSWAKPCPAGAPANNASLLCDASGWCFQLFTAPRPYPEAREACRALKGSLLVPSTPGRQRMVEKYLFEDNRPAATVGEHGGPLGCACSAQLRAHV